MLISRLLHICDLTLNNSKQLLSKPNKISKIICFTISVVIYYLSPSHLCCLGHSSVMFYQRQRIPSESLQIFREKNKTKKIGTMKILVTDERHIWTAVYHPTIEIMMTLI